MIYEGRLLSGEMCFIRQVPRGNRLYLNEMSDWEQSVLTEVFVVYFGLPDKRGY